MTRTEQGTGDTAVNPARTIVARAVADGTTIAEAMDRVDAERFTTESLQACRALRAAFPTMSRVELAGHLSNLGVPDAAELVAAAERWVDLVVPAKCWRCGGTDGVRTVAGLPFGGEQLCAGCRVAHQHPAEGEDLAELAGAGVEIEA
jgi:hypothetical protein